MYGQQRRYSSIERTLTVSRLIPKADRKKIHEYLFREGVLVAKKDFNLPKHNEIDTRNLY
ncbi:40S ribosomal protein S10-A, partial [Cryomyces antarcticus]